jgi:hypothetical protein
MGNLEVQAYLWGVKESEIRVLENWKISEVSLETKWPEGVVEVRMKGRMCQTMGWE